MDVIVIGGGIGGLTLAALLAAQDRRKVLLLEAQEDIGGFAREFVGASGSRFDMGALHIGSMHPGSRLRQVLDLAAGRSLPWRELGFDLETYVFEDDEFVVPASVEQFRQRLQNRFPLESQGLDLYFASIKPTAAAYLLWQMGETFPPWLAGPLRLFLRLRRPSLFRSVAQQLRRWIGDPQLIRILSAPWAAYGTSPEAASFGYHCLHVDHHMGGAWYPETGLAELAKALVGSIEKAGGEVRRGVTVQQILVRNGAACGVRLSDGREIESRAVVSNAGVELTYRTLLPPPYAQSDLSLSASGYSAFMLCLDFVRPLSVLGLTCSNYRVYGPDGLPIFLTLTSVKRGDQSPRAQVVGLCERSATASDVEPLAERSLRLLDEKFPGFKDLIRNRQLISPAAFKIWNAGGGGAILGLPPSVERMHWRWTRARSSVHNLYLTGSDVLGPGFGSAILGALKTYELLNNGRSWRSARRILREVKQFASGELT